MPRSLSDGHEKVAVLIVEPDDPANPTVTELAAGIDASLKILASDWSFGPTDSETFSEAAVGEDLTPSAYSRSNGQFGMSVWRYFDEDGLAEAIADALFAAVKVKGSRIWVYARETSKMSSEPWEAGDEIRYGAEVLTDTPQKPDAGGYIKRRIPGQIQRAWPEIVADAA